MIFVMKQERNNLRGRRMYEIRVNVPTYSLAGSEDFIEQKHGTLMKRVRLEGYAEGGEMKYEWGQCVVKRHGEE